MAGEPSGRSPAPGEDASFALALVNTRLLQVGRPADLIADTGRAGEWLADPGVMRGGSAISDAEAAALRALRESIRGLLSARATADAPVAGDVGLLNAALAAAPPIPALAWDESGPRRAEQGYGILPGTIGGQRLPGGPDKDQRQSGMAVALSRLADDALTLLTAPGGAEPVLCGAHGCIRWFLRTHAARQWCSTRCGDRVRAARHYAHHHPATQPPGS